MNTNIVQDHEVSSSKSTLERFCKAFDLTLNLEKHNKDGWTCCLLTKKKEICIVSSSSGMKVQSRLCRTLEDACSDFLNMILGTTISSSYLTLVDPSYLTRCMQSVKIVSVPKTLEELELKTDLNGASC